MRCTVPGVETRTEIPRIVNEAITVWGALQKPGELAGLLDVLNECTFGDMVGRNARKPGPPRVVEIGSDAGGTLYAWRALWPTAQVVSVSLPDGPFGSSRPLVAHGATIMERDSHEVETVFALDALLGAPPDVLFVDGDHTTEGCAADVQMYGELLNPGGVLILHDICHHESPAVGVEYVWRDLGAQWIKLAEIIAPPTNWGGIGVAVRA